MRSSSLLLWPRRTLAAAALALTLVPAAPALAGEANVVLPAFTDQVITLLYVVFGSAIVALAFGVLLAKKVMKADPGTPRMIQVAKAIQEGAKAYLTRQMKALLIMILAPLAAMLVQMAISRTREYSADRLGAEICGQPRWLASALQRIEQAARGRVMASAERNPASAHLFIVNPLHLGGVDNLFRTHPATAERVRRLLELEQGSGGVAAAPPGVRYGSVPRAGGRRSPWG